MMDKNFMAKVLIKLILHDKSYNSKACQHSPASHVALATVFHVQQLSWKSVRFQAILWAQASSGKAALSRCERQPFDGW